MSDIEIIVNMAILLTTGFIFGVAAVLLLWQRGDHK